jgi:hypothetical protein
MLLAVKLHWSRESILALSRAEFDFYLAELIEKPTPP